MTRVYIAIDPGLKGGILAFNSETRKPFLAEPMPMTSWGYDTKKLCSYINQIKKEFPNCVVVTEKLHAIFGVDANSTFKLGMAYQNVLGSVQLMGVPLIEIKPTDWTKVMWLNLTQIYKPLTKKQREKNAAIEAGEAGTAKLRVSKPKLDSKKMSAQAVEKIFPNEKCYKIGKATHDGLIDCLLIAEYARRMNL